MLILLAIFYDYYLLYNAVAVIKHTRQTRATLTCAKQNKPAPGTSKRIDPTRVTVGYELNRNPKNING